MGTAAEMIFKTPRLCACNFADSDRKRLQSFGGKAEVARMMTSLKSPWNEADVKAWMKRAPYRGALGFRVGIYLDGHLIGFVGIGGDPVTCAYAIDPDYWGKGYASEALHGLLTHCFDNLGLEIVEADHFDDNPASGHILRKTGFVKTGNDTGISGARSELAPMTIYRLTKSQFKAT